MSTSIEESGEDYWRYIEPKFFYVPTGVLAPEAVAGFLAIGLYVCAGIIEKTMSFFGDPYPRDQEKHIEFLDQIHGDTPIEWKPFYHLDEKFFEGLGYGEERFLKAADSYTRQAKSARF
jgi:hypothetical protein